MSELKRLTMEQLRPIVETFSKLTWPVSRADVKLMATELGWEVASDRTSGMKIRSGLEFNVSRVDVLLDDEDCVLKVSLPATETDHDEKVDLSPTFRALSEDLDSILGTGGVKTPGTNRYHWELENSCRIALEDIDIRIILQVLAPRWASVERAEERQGLDPSRPFDGHQEASG